MGSPQMLRATSVLRKAAVRPERVADTLGLAHRDRNRGGVTATTAGGLEIEIALDKPAVLNDGGKIHNDAVVPPRPYLYWEPSDVEYLAVLLRARGLIAWSS